jgi:hypothetical protein
MRKYGRVALVGVVIAALAALVAVPAGAQSSNDKPTATEVGVTASEIHIAVVADVDNPFAPGLFKGSVDGTKAGAAYLNSKAGGGGLAGRKVVVDFYDSKLSANDSRNAMINACQNDYSLVGGASLFLSSADDIVNCQDKAGKAVGIPDMASFMSGLVQSCSAMAFPAIGGANDCSTLNQNPQTYYGNAGPDKWLLSQNKGGLKGPMVIGNDSKDGARGGTILALASQAAGVKADPSDVIGKSGRDPQSAYTGMVQQMKSDGANFSLMTSAATSALELRDEAQLQGIDSSKVAWECVSCYGNKIVTDNASSFEGEYQFLGFLPFEEGKYNKTLAAFLKNIKQVGGTPDQFSAYSFEAVLAFAQAVNSVVKSDGVNGLTRSNLVTGIKSLTDFDANGMAGTHSFKTGITTNCFAMVQFKSGKWVRVYPTKKGTFDCKSSNTVAIKANLIGG